MATGLPLDSSSVSFSVNAEQNSRVFARRSGSTPGLYWGVWGTQVRFSGGLFRDVDHVAKYVS